MKCRKLNPKQNILPKESRDEAQGPCQTGSFMTSLLHLHRLRCKLEIGVRRQARLMFKSRISIVNKCHWILCFKHKHFLFGCLLSSLQLEAVRVSMPNSTTKITKLLRLMLFLSNRMRKLLRFGVT